MTLLIIVLCNVSERACSPFDRCHAIVQQQVYQRSYMFYQGCAQNALRTGFYILLHVLKFSYMHWAVFTYS